MIEMHNKNNKENHQPSPSTSTKMINLTNSNSVDRKNNICGQLQNDKESQQMLKCLLLVDDVYQAVIVEKLGLQDNQNYCQIIDWFRQKNIKRGNPQQFAQQHRHRFHKQQRQLSSGSSTFLPRLNIQNSVLNKKRSHKE